MSKYERLARLLKIITLVRVNHRLTRSDLARLCEVNSVRTIQRDIDSLCIAGVPIYWSGEGYEIMPDFFLPPLNLSLEEAFHIVVAARTFSEDEGRPQRRTIESAVSKIIARLPHGTRHDLEAILDKASEGKESGQLLPQTNRHATESLNA